MNFLALVQNTKREFGRLTSGPASVATATGRDMLLRDWVIESWKKIQELPHNWAWMRREATASLVAGQGSYTAGDLGITRLGYFRDEDEDYTPVVWQASSPDQIIPLTWIPYDTFRRAYQRGTQTNDQPQHWSVAPDGALLIGPAPDDTYTLSIDYQLSPQELSTDLDVPEMPSRYHMLIVWGALADAGVFDAAPEVVGRAQTNYQETLTNLIANQGSRITLMGR